MDFVSKKMNKLLEDDGEGCCLLCFRIDMDECELLEMRRSKPTLNESFYISGNPQRSPGTS